MNGRGFNIAHQKFSVDIDIEAHAVKGRTVLTLVPTDPELRSVVLDARRMRILRVLVDGHSATFRHLDTLNNPPNAHISWSAPQAHLYRSKLQEHLNPNGPGDLVVELPGETVVKDAEASGFMGNAAGGDEKSYEALTVEIEYETLGRPEGLNFVGGRGSGIPRSHWHAYTTQSPIGQATSTWLPCVDGLWSLSTWEMEFVVLKVVDDSDSEDLELVVVGNSTQPTQVAHPTDPKKKLVKFEMFSPVSSQHIGFAVGAFAAVQLQVGTDQTTNENGQQSERAVPITVYSLPDRQGDVGYSCGIFQKAMDFFTREVGSFPFQSYSICFVSEMPYDVVDAISLNICSDRLLFSSQAIEPLFEEGELLIRGLAAQWSGVNIVPYNWSDLWLTEGIALFMTRAFIRQLMGTNEFRYRIRRANEMLVDEDIGRPALSDATAFQFPLIPDDLSFIRLKAPLILYILDRRLTKTDRSLGIKRVLSRLFLQGMSGELSGCIKTYHFQKLCERVAHHRLDTFFSEWIYSAGYPIFRVTQRFNKKRMFIEMGIGQVHSRELPPEVLRAPEFLDRAVQTILHDSPKVPAVFLGPMTIRIHEADGTPYEHVVQLKESFTKLDIQYNTKYKRLRRAQKFRIGGDIKCLGDVLMSDKDIDEWRLSDWGEGDEDEYMFNEAFEWLRVDADFEWLGRMFVGQPDYMYASQLQQDRDVVAQVDAVEYFATQPPSPIYSSILTRTLMDRRYYYGVRVRAALGLSKCATEHINFLGKFHLFKCFQQLFCFEDSLVPRANDFTDIPQYFVQKAIPQALALIRDLNGRCPLDVAQFLLDLIRYNENSGNPYSDSAYLASLIRAVVTTLRPLQPEDIVDTNDPQVQAFVARVTAEIDKCQRLDRWLPSRNYQLMTTAVEMDEVLIRLGYGRPRFDKLVLSTQPGSPTPVRLVSFQTLLNLGGYRREALMKYVIQTALLDQAADIRLGILRCLATMSGEIALHGEYAAAAPQKAESAQELLQQRQETLARGSVITAIPLLRKEMNSKTALSQNLWVGILSPLTGAYERRRLLELCLVLYEPSNSLIVTLPTPKLHRLSMKRRHDFYMVAKYRSVLKKHRSSLVQHDDAPKLKLKLK